MTGTIMPHRLAARGLIETRGTETMRGANELIQDLVERHQSWLIHLAASYLRDVQAAEDCVQDVFLNAITKLDPTLSDASMRNWLAACTANRAKSVLRSARIRRVVLTDKHDFIERGQGHLDDYAALDDSGTLTHVMNLPIKYREVVVLRYYHDLPIADMARILAVSENTVKTRLKRGKERLRQVLKTDNRGDD